MGSLGEIRRGVRRLFHLGLWGPDPDDAVDWEIEHHILEQADELEAEGWSRDEAEAEACRRFGNLEGLRREMRVETRGQARRSRVGLWLETVWQDLSYGLRGTRRSPAFSSGLVLTLGLGIGATVAVFVLVDALLLRPLPYADSEQLANLEVQYGDAGWLTGWLPLDLIRDWRADDRSFAASMAYRGQSLLYTSGPEPRELSGQAVSPSFEEVLGVAPFLGRGLRPDDAAPGAPPVALASYGFWKEALGGDPDAVGRTLRLDDRSYTVVGVMPRGFKFPMYARMDLWVPFPDGGPMPGRPGTRAEMLVRADGSLASSLARARTQAAGLFEGRADLDSATVHLAALEGSRGGSDELRRAVWLLFGAVGLILLVAVVNGSNLMLVRGAGRVREVSVRLALGASRGRVVRQLATEALTLALAAGVVAVVVAVVALRALQGVLPDTLVFWLPYDLAVERRAVTFAFGLALAVGGVLGLLPALRGTRWARATARAGMTVYAAGDTGRSRLRRGLIVAEVAVSVVLLAGAGLLLNSFLRLTAVDIGVDTHDLAFVQIPIRAQAQPDSAARATFLPRLEERVRGLPGVVAATATGTLPSSRLTVGTALQAEGRPPAGGDPEILPVASVSPRFFDVMGARLLKGRPFRSDDRWEDAAIVDEDLAAHLWPDSDAVGRRFRIDADSPWLTVVGVMADIQLVRRDDAWGDFEVLRPFNPVGATGYVTLAVRTADDPTAHFQAFRDAVQEIAPNQPIEEIVTADAAYGETLQLPRFLALLVIALAAFALLLATVGLFAVLAFDVAQRTREIGIRMSLGANSRRLRRMVVREGLALAAIGVIIGLPMVLLAGRFIRSLLFHLQPADPLTLGLVVVTMFVAAGLASYLPARRTTRVHPMEALRVE